VDILIAVNEQFPVEVREYLLDPSGADGPLLSIVHLGADYVVVNKPDGLLSAPGRGDHKFDSVKTRVQQVFPEANGSICIHRLDMDTSGLLVLALNRRSHRAISRQFEFRKTGKTYIAVLQGIVAEDEGAVELPLIVDWPNRPARWWITRKVDRRRRSTVCANVTKRGA
jgi:23S rRNA-/tRNA-specific pseudouridylate synthase